MQKTSGGTRLCSQPSRMKHSHGPVPGPSRRKQVSTNSWLNHLLRGDWSLVLCHCQYNGMLLWSYITNIKPGHIIHFKTGRHWNIPAHNKYILWHLNFHSQDASVQVYILCDDGADDWSWLVCGGGPVTCDNDTDHPRPSWCLMMIMWPSFTWCRSSQPSTGRFSSVVFFESCLKAGNH